MASPCVYPPSGRGRTAVACAGQAPRLCLSAFDHVRRSFSYGVRYIGVRLVILIRCRGRGVWIEQRGFLICWSWMYQRGGMGFRHMHHSCRGSFWDGRVFIYSKQVVVNLVRGTDICFMKIFQRFGGRIDGFAKLTGIHLTCDLNGGFEPANNLPSKREFDRW